MIEPKFTPGEWTRDGQFQTTAGDFRLLYDCKPINVTVPADEAAANAALIAAAPEMYEGLKEIRDVMEKDGRFCRTVEAIDKLLKKARGEA